MCGSAFFSHERTCMFTRARVGLQCGRTRHDRRVVFCSHHHVELVCDTQWQFATVGSEEAVECGFLMAPLYGPY